jgi:DNA-binding MarR family transcriptional regulator
VRSYRARVAEPLWTDARISALPSWSIIRASLLVAPRLAATLAPVGLTPTQFGVLVQLDNEPGLTQSALARRCLMSPQSMGELLPALESSGHVVREAGPRRGRPTPVHLTEAGRAALVRATTLVEGADRPAALGLDPDELTTLTALLGRVTAAVAAAGTDEVSGP